MVWWPRTQKLWGAEMAQTITVRSSYDDPDTPPEASDVSWVRDKGLRKLLWKMFFNVRTIRQLRAVLNDIEHLPPSTGRIINEGIEAFSANRDERSHKVNGLFRGRLDAKYRLHRSAVWGLREWVNLFGEVSHGQATSEKKIYGMDPKDAALEILLFIHTRLPRQELLPDKSLSAGRHGGQRRIGLGRVSLCR
jgi:hypothetical protein